MSANFSVYVSEEILNNIFLEGAVLTQYSNMYLALFHDSNGTTETNLRKNTPVNEISDSNYNRILMPITGGASFNAPIAAVGGGMTIDNKVKISFGAAAANYPYAVTFVALFDALTGGNVILYTSISSQGVALAEYVEIDINDLDITL